MGNWLDIKKEVLVELENAKVTDKVFINKFLKLERYVNTCRNMLNSYTWEYVNYSKPFNEGVELLTDLKENHFEDYKKYQDSNGKISPHILNFGDLIC